MATEFKGNHKACKNHPDKYAVARGLCAACIKAETGKTYKPETHRHATKEKKAEAIREAQTMGTHLSDADMFTIGKKYGVSRSTIANWLKETKQPKPAKAEVKEIKREETQETDKLAKLIEAYEGKIAVCKAALILLKEEAA